MTTATARRHATDAVLLGAKDLARAAAEEIAAPGHVGDHLGVDVEAERLATHRFACLDPAYTGWHWAVTVARVARAKTATVCEAVLLPGPEALLAPEWLPWSKRLAPGDIGVGDLLPTEADDDRLEPGYTAAGRSRATAADDGSTLDDSTLDDADRVALWELGLGRARVLSPVGRDDAVDRWYSGAHGPHAPVAEAAPAPCSTCGFVVPLAGSLRLLFGVCANAYSPSDGRVVSFDHGCGAHSEGVVLPDTSVEVAETVVDEVGYDLVALHPEGSVEDSDDAVATADAESLGHS